MPTAQDIIARFRVTGAETFNSSIKNARRELDNISGSAGRFRSALRGLASPIGLLAGAAGAGGLFALGQQAFHAAADFEQLKATLEVLTGSAVRAKAKLDFIQALALPSTFTFNELAEAGVRIQAFGVNLERVLPLAAKMGAVFGNTKERLMDFISIFGRLKSGQFPEIEILSGFGLSKMDFKQQGVKFDKSGSLLSSARDTMAALERIVESRYGNILDKMGNTTNAKLATLQDKWEITMRKVGEALIKLVLPMLERFSTSLDNLNKNKSFDTFLQNLGDKFVKLVGIMVGGLTILFFAVAAVKLVMKDYFGAIVAGVMGIATLVIGGGIVKRMKNSLKGLNTGAGGDTAVPVPKAPPGTPFFTGDDPVQKNIEANTRRTADNTSKMEDLKRYVVGGGERSRMALNPVAVGGINSGNVTVNAGYFTEALTRFLEEYERQKQRF